MQMLMYVKLKGTVLLNVGGMGLSSDTDASADKLTQAEYTELTGLLG